MLIPLEPNNASDGFFIDSITGKLGLYKAGVLVLTVPVGAASLEILKAIVLSQAITGTVDVSGATVTLPSSLIRYSTATIPAADIPDTNAGKFGHANGQQILAAAGAGTAIEHLSTVIVNDYSTAAWGAGGNVSVNYGGGGGAVSGVVSAANSIGAAGDKVASVIAVVPANNQLLVNTGLNLVAAAAFTQPGTAAGVVRTLTAYRVHATGL